MKKTKKRSLKYIGLNLAFVFFLTGCGAFAYKPGIKYHPFERRENYDSFEEFMSHYKHQLEYDKANNTTKSFIIDCSDITNEETLNTQYSISGMDHCCDEFKRSCQDEEYHYYGKWTQFSHDGYEIFYINNSKCTVYFFLEFLRAYEYVDNDKGYDLVITEKNINIEENPELHNNFSTYEGMNDKWYKITQGDGLEQEKRCVAIKNGDIPLGLFGVNFNVQYNDEYLNNREEYDEIATDYTLAKAQEILDKVIDSYSNLVDEIISNGGSL